jgi:hypothetical protein
MINFTIKQNYLLVITINIFSYDWANLGQNYRIDI